MAPPASTIQELWIFPVKSCRGISVASAQLTPTGLEFDRAWCIVDLDGANVSRLEAISQRKMPALATVAVSFSADRAQLLLDAPGMPQMAVPTAWEDYAGEEAMRVECSGRSTTTGDGWSLGFVDARAHAGASLWLSEYLNREKAPGGGSRVGGGKASRYALARSAQGIKMDSYAPIFPLLARAAEDPAYRGRFAGNAKRFADFAPLLLASRASARFVGDRCPGGSPYPTRPLRGNVVVDGLAGPWAEESWRRIKIVPAGASGGEAAPSEAGVELLKIKECPRCTVPCRDQWSGGWVFPADYLLMWKVLRRAFPRKDRDPEWGCWVGPFFGVYFGNAGVEGVLHVGDSIFVAETCRWDEHLRWVSPGAALGAGALLAIGAAAIGAWSRSCRSR